MIPMMRILSLCLWTRTAPVAACVCQTSMSSTASSRRMRDRYIRNARSAPDLKACPEGTQPDAENGNCVRQSYERRMTGAARKLPCPTGTTDFGDACWDLPHVFGRLRVAGCKAQCYPNEEERRFLGITSCLKKCPPGYSNDGLTCRKENVGIKVGPRARWACSSGDEEVVGKECYETCRAGHASDGKKCVPDTGPGIITPVKDRYLCPPGLQRIGQFCYAPCRAGYAPPSDDSPECWQVCPDGFEPDDSVPGAQRCRPKAPATTPAATGGARAHVQKKRSSTKPVAATKKPKKRTNASNNTRIGKKR